MRADSFDLNPVGPVRLHRNTGWDQIFSTYDSKWDGVVHIATYSFHPGVLSAWERLEPFFRVTVAPGPRNAGDQYRKNAVQLARQYPLSQVRVAQKLHTKAALFSGTGRLFIGSQNFYTPTATFDETIVEMRLLTDDREDVVERLFRSIRSEFIRPIFNVDDIKIYGNGPAAGFACVPPNWTLQHWDIDGAVRIFKSGTDGLVRDYSYRPRRLYALMRYDFGQAEAVMAFDRSYTFCGELTLEAYAWLKNHCNIREVQAGPCGYWRGALPGNVLAKDEIIRIHPVTQAGPAKECVYIEEVREPDAHRQKVVFSPKLNLQARML